MIRNVPSLIDDVDENDDIIDDVDEIGDIINDWYWWWHDLDDISDEIDDIIDDILVIFGWNLVWNWWYIHVCSYTWGVIHGVCSIVVDDFWWYLDENRWYN